MKKPLLAILLIVFFLLGWFGSQIFHTATVKAANLVEYRLVPPIAQGAPEQGTQQLEALLNTYGKQGWRLHSVISGDRLIFER
ncbi:MAG TPA: hypothetical protein VGX03_33220 [Candidatus Binatia bacterium]|nr:hypothetical protein [Candidatus Binatia bacterium]